jgi:hypothetical protein
MNENYVIDIIANLARRVLEIERELLEYKTLGIRDHLREGNDVLNNRVHSLEQQLRGTQRNLETFAEQTENNTQDIAMLDERTQPESAEVVTFEKFLDSIADKVAQRLVGGGS